MNILAACYHRSVAVRRVLPRLLVLTLYAVCMSCQHPRGPTKTPASVPHSPVGPWRSAFDEDSVPLHKATFNLFFFFGDGTVVQLRRPLIQVSLEIQQDQGRVNTNEVDPTVTLTVGKWTRDGNFITINLSDQDSRKLQFASEDRLDTDVPGLYLQRIREGVLKWAPTGDYQQGRS